MHPAHFVITSYSVPWVRIWPNGPGVAVKAPCPLTTGFGARGAAEDKKALQVDLTHDKRRQGLEGVRRADYTQGVVRRDVTKTSTAWETPRGTIWRPLCAGVRQRRGRPKGIEDWKCRGRQSCGLPRGRSVEGSRRRETTVLKVEG